ncbi:hypothetical protein F1645_06165 [Novacetimonas hansenii]|uniref:Uncharacterized protein n=2 Tax=Novacetimonas hansenii TaxID=436 RepID=A0ABQ0SIN8_NOVHA|nr:hypothetical protein GXY_11878 [Novacetimonas hansenii ATCC 23769]GAN84812.1 hypothetical protein Gaha_0232_012 [Novacetimonas hansenii JCM 7643]GBQ58689.1 hypothetical protein AA0243_1857 [Novacetimonas hansenii NRIC 0243]GEC65227.1 hypothetical protein GHA01_30760 [Novacetimonas hansenii]
MTDQSPLRTQLIAGIEKARVRAVQARTLLDAVDEFKSRMRRQLAEYARLETEALQMLGAVDPDKAAEIRDAPIGNAERQRTRSAVADLGDVLFSIQSVRLAIYEAECDSAPPTPPVLGAPAK